DRRVGRRLGINPRAGGCEAAARRAGELAAHRLPVCRLAGGGAPRSGARTAWMAGQNRRRGFHPAALGGLPFRPARRHCDAGFAIAIGKGEASLIAGTLILSPFRTYEPINSNV